MTLRNKKNDNKNIVPDILDTLITKKLGTDCDDDKSRYGKNIH